MRATTCRASWHARTLRSPAMSWATQYRSWPGGSARRACFLQKNRLGTFWNPHACGVKQVCCGMQVTDLGTARYPRYHVWRTRPVWRTRAALLAYEAALEHAAVLDSALEASALLSQIRAYLAMHDATEPDAPPLYGLERNHTMCCISQKSGDAGLALLWPLYYTGKFSDLTSGPSAQCIHMYDVHSVSVQAGTLEAAEVALQPAWAALQAGEHKVPPTPPRPPQAACRPAPSPFGAGPSCSASGGGFAEGSARRRLAGACSGAGCAMVEALAGSTGAARSAGCTHDGPLAAKAEAADCSFGATARAGPGSSVLSPFSPSPPTGSEARTCSAECPDGPASGQRGRPGSSRRCSGASEASTDRDGGDGVHTPPRTRGPRASAQQGSPACAEPCAATQRVAAQAAASTDAAATDAGGGGFCTPPRPHGRRSWGQQGSASHAEPSAAMLGGSAQPSEGPVLAGAAAASSAIPQDEWPAAPFLRRFSAPWVHVSMATAGVALREKQRRYAEAADLLRMLLGAGASDM